MTNTTTIAQTYTQRQVTLLMYPLIPLWQALVQTRERSRKSI
ncbi:MAG: hypothetical protein SAL07_22890 [Oscillatoria sp. PMC 1051.18]|nr:hypothetical protein [Oscillatoria sp. PMC 1050.18]MEC5032758.1 hypothetical protein [Oscillatoria sp. PMC 1051.18]